jgi:hypothetical protein
MPTVGSYTALQLFSFVAVSNSTGPVTINVSGVGQQALVQSNGAAMTNGQIVTGQFVIVGNDGVSQFWMISPVAAGATATSTGFRNWLLNGAMAVWQRGAGGSATIAVAASTIAYTADRWYLATGANQACTVAQNASSVVGARYGARVVRNNGQTGTGQLVFAQPLDADVIALLAGQTMTLSAQATTGGNWSPASGTISYKVYCGTGAVGKRNATPYTGETAPISGSTNLGVGGGPFTLTPASGLIPANTTQMEVQFFWTPVGTAGLNDWWQPTDIQLEIGSAATAFDYERLNFITELAQCQRFYEKSFAYGTAPAQNVGTTGAYQIGNPGFALFTPVPFMTRKRVAATTTTFNPSAANANWRDITGAADSAVTVTTTNENNIILAGPSLVGGHQQAIHWQADAEI